MKTTKIESEPTNLKTSNQDNNSSPKYRQCKLCKKKLVGRLDKIFCSVKCKSNYHIKLNKVTLKASERIDKILHRNRSILLEILGKKILSKKVDKILLDKKKFNYTYVTAYHINSQNKMVNMVYDFSWVVFSDQEVLIKRLKEEV